MIGHRGSGFQELLSRGPYNQHRLLKFVERSHATALDFRRVSWARLRQQYFFQAGARLTALLHGMSLQNVETHLKHSDTAGTPNSSENMSCVIEHNVM